ncbi:MAG: glycosyltransferase [Candidatus Methanoperedens sp.]|nr:glycosyltransferase [Candidatus Methanoperedens sp.]
MNPGSEGEKYNNKKSRVPVSFGLPVYNGEKYLEAALDSILAQTFTDFELVISDNASTDRTQEICQAYAKKDSRIRYHRIEKNRGAAWNFNNVFSLSSGAYFKWAAHDDLIAPDYLSKCIKVLEEDNSIVLCSSRTEIIDEYGTVIADYILKLNTNQTNKKIRFNLPFSRRYLARKLSVNSVKPQDRFGDAIFFHPMCFEVFGLIRSDVLRKTSLIKSYPGSDLGLLAELSLLGRFFEIPEYLFFNRDHAERSVRAHPDMHHRSVWFDSSKGGQISFPHWRFFFEYFNSTNRFSLAFYERVCCYGHLMNWLRSHSRQMAMELKFAAIYYLNPVRKKNKL